MNTAQKLIERRLDKMRLGKATCEIENLLSEPDVRVALVPLTEAEYDLCMENVVKMNVPETLTGQQFRDRALTLETLLRAAREPEDISKPMFSSVEEMNDALEVADVNYLIDMYFEMVEKSSPALEGFTEEQLSDVKKVLLEMDWSGLSGKQWYALKRFLSSLGPQQLLAKLPGSSSTQQLTGMKNSEEPTPEIAEDDSQNLTAKSVESQ